MIALLALETRAARRSADGAQARAAAPRCPDAHIPRLQSSSVEKIKRFFVEWTGTGSVRA